MRYAPPQARREAWNVVAGACVWRCLLRLLRLDG